MSKYYSGRNLIGDGKIPNRYFVSISNDYYYFNSKVGGFDWISDLKLFKVKSKIIKNFATYKQAINFIDNDLYLGMEYGGIKVQSIFIEDRLSGELYHQYNSFDAENCHIEQYQIHEDTRFTKEELEKRSIKFN